MLSLYWDTSKMSLMKLFSTHKGVQTVKPVYFLLHNFCNSLATPGTHCCNTTRWERQSKTTSNQILLMKSGTEL